MEYTLNEFRSVYADTLRHLYRQSRRQTFHWLDPSRFKLADFDQVTQDERIRVAVLGSQPIGFISWYSPDNFIHHLFVDPAFVHQGVGKALLEDCLSILNRPARLKCLQQNRNAIGFYLAQGWWIEAQGDSEDGRYYLMRKDD